MLDHIGEPGEAPAAASDVVLVFTRKGKAYDSVLSLVKGWTVAGLVKDSIWIDAATPTQGLLLSKEGSGSIVVAEELSTRDVRKLRAVSLLLASNDEELSALPASNDEVAIQETYRALAAEANIPYTGGVLVAALPGLAIPQCCFHPGWRFNLLVSPEDCISDDRMGVEYNLDTLPGVAGSTLLTATGLWRWSDEARVDDMRSTGGSSDAQVQLARSYVRLADGGYTMSDIVDAALSLDKTSGSWPLPYEQAQEYVQSDDPEGTIARAAGEFIETFHLSFSPLVSPGVVPPQKMKIWDAIKLFPRTVWKIIRGLPINWINKKEVEIEDAVLKFFQSRTFGEDSSVVLTLRGHSLIKDQSHSTGLERLNEISHLNMPGADVVTPEPQLWTAFWTVGSGLADGGDFAPAVSHPMRGTARLLVTTPDLISPATEDEMWFRHELLADFKISPVDAFRAAELARALQDAILKKQGLSQVASSDAPAVDQSVEVESDDASAAMAAEDLGVQATSNAIGAEELEALDVEQLQDVATALHGWAVDRGRKNSFAWRIGEAIGNGVVTASRELVDALAIIYKGRSDEGPTEEEKKHTARFRRFVRWVLLGFVTVLVLIVALCVGGAITIAILAIAIPVIAIALFAWTMRKFLVFAREQARAEFKRNQALDEYWFAFNRAHAAASGIAHFCSTYWQYLDWAKVLSLMTREPWGRAESHADAVDLVDVPHPMSVTIGKAIVSVDQFQRRVAAAQQVVTTPGWLRTAIERHVRLSTTRTAELMHIGDPTSTDATRDIAPLDTVKGTHAATGEKIYSPRGQVCHDAADRRFTGKARMDEASQILADTLNEPIDELFTSVSVPPPAGRGLSGDDLSEFFADLVPKAERLPKSYPAKCYRVPELNLPNDVQLALPSVVKFPSTDLVTSPVVTNTSAEYGDRFVIGSHRLDLSPAYPFSELSLIAEDANKTADPSDHQADANRSNDVQIP